jgi:hypothetical protein
MANIKFSQFTPQTDYNNVTDLVGYDGLVNVRITPNDLINSWNNDQQVVRFSNLLPVGTASDFGIGGPGNSSTILTLDTGGTASYQINGLDAVSYNGTNWNLANGVVDISTTTTSFQSNILTIGDGSGNVILDFKNIITGTSSITMGGVAFTKFDQAANIFEIGPNQEISWDPTGAVGLRFGGFPNRFITQASFENDVVDITGGPGGAGAVLVSNGGGGLGVTWEQKNPGCQVKIVGTSGLANTNNGADFLVPYNTVTVNDDATIFNPVVTGGLGNQGAIQVLKAGRYAFQARYSSFDLVQAGLPTVDGTIFFRITAATDTVASGIGTKQCVLQDLIVATSGNGEAVVTGAGYMDLNANDYFKIVGFHNGATGGSGTQGFPVNSNAFFNEPQLWLVKIQ